MNLSDFDLTKESSIEPNPPPSLFAIAKSQKLFLVYVSSKENNAEFSYQKCNPIKITKNGNFSFSLKCANRESRAAVTSGGTAVISFRKKARLRIVQYLSHKMVDFSQYLLKIIIFVILQHEFSRLLRLFYSAKILDGDRSISKIPVSDWFIFVE